MLAGELKKLLTNVPDSFEVTIGEFCEDITGHGFATRVADGHTRSHEDGRREDDSNILVLKTDE